MATDVAVDFDNELRKLKLQTYQNISPAKVWENPPTNVQNRVGGVEVQESYEMAYFTS